MFAWLKHGETQSIKRNFSRIQSKEDAFVLFEKSYSGYNILHDLIRISPTNDRISVDSFKYLRGLLFQVFCQQEIDISWHFKSVVIGSCRIQHQRALVGCRNWK